MSILHIVRLPVQLKQLASFTVREKAEDDDNGYALHLAMRRRFGTAAPQPFCFFPDKGYLLGYTTDAQALHEAAMLPAMDEKLAAVFPAAPAIKVMPEGWRIGARYGFEVRIRPVVRYGKKRQAERIAAGQHKAHERDAFLAALERQPQAAITRQEIYSNWLIRRLEKAATVNNSVVQGMRRLHTCRSLHEAGRKTKIEGYEVTFRGILTVEDDVQFANILTRGIGRHAAFGFGMLLLTPAGKF